MPFQKSSSDSGRSTSFFCYFFIFASFNDLNSKMKYTPSLWTLIAYFQRPLTIKVAQYFSILHLDILLWLWFYVYIFFFIFVLFFSIYCMLFNYVHDACMHTQKHTESLQFPFLFNLKRTTNTYSFTRRKKNRFFFIQLFYRDTCNNWICLGHSCAYIHRTVLEILLYLNSSLIFLFYVFILLFNP